MTSSQQGKELIVGCQQSIEEPRSLQDFINTLENGLNNKVPEFADYTKRFWFTKSTQTDARDIESKLGN